jgi:acetyl-CoA acyltransferase
MADIVIAEAVRSAVGRSHKGSLAQKRPDELAGEVIAALLKRVPQVQAKDVEDVVLGCAMPEGEQGLNIARVASLLGGLTVDSSAMTVNRFCSSGLQAIALAAGAVSLGYNDLVIAGWCRVHVDGPDDREQAQCIACRDESVPDRLHADGHHR